MNPNNEITGQTIATDGPPQFLMDASAAVNAGRLDEAIAILERNVDRHSFTAYSGIGDIYLLQGQNQEALQWLEKAGRGRLRELLCRSLHSG